jgi:hypothetical protein
MARNAGQLISRGPRTWLVRVSHGRDLENSDGNRPRLKNLVQVPIDYYAMGYSIDDRQYMAGAEFHKALILRSSQAGIRPDETCKPTGRRGEPGFPWPIYVATYHLPALEARTAVLLMKFC